MDFSTLNERQKEAVLAPAGPLLIVAGAGTGKTRTLMARLLYLIERGVRPDSLCAITFTNKAANEMRERVEKQIADRKSQIAIGHPPFIGTFHSLGARILRANARMALRSANFAIFDADDSFSLVKKILKRLEIKPDRLKPSAAVKKISAIKNGALFLETLENSRREEDRKVAAVFREYEKELEKNNAFDFDDLLKKSVDLLTKNSAIRASYQKRYAHILVDEYQDINRTQYELLKLLAGEKNAITVVGDDAQTIYSWRQADVNIFLDFEKNWPDAKTVILDENYRSTPTIITAASALIAKNEKQKPKVLWTKNPDGARITISEWGSEDEEAESVAREVTTLIANRKSQIAHYESSATSDRQLAIGDTRLAISDTPSIAVLYRTNAQSRAVEQSLIEAGIPYQVFGGLKFYERKEIRDIIAALRFASNPLDSMSRERLEKTFYQRKTAAILEHIAAVRNKKPQEIIEEFLKAARYFEYLDAHLTNADERRENIAELIYFASRSGNLTEFLEHASLLQSGDAPSGQIANREAQIAGHKSSATGDKRLAISNPVHLMTIHLAKGLEFDHVFLIGCREDLMPHAFSLESEAEIEEERRLLYVAMTRAKKTLHISYHDVPSRFLFEIPEEFTAFQSSSGDEILSDDEEKYISFD